MENRKANKLINETSPYLLQHAYNPVDWFPWSDEALQKAKDENKLILVSIGYSACHWCHVMEQESFEDQDIANIMNEHFVCIKVDREERPDIDHVYMNAVQLIARNGGWPLNCFALPDGSPVYGGTYFRPGEWKNILENLAMSFKTSPEKFHKAASEVKQGLQFIENIVKTTAKDDFYKQDVSDVIFKLKQHFDLVYGGTKGAPKFPLPVNYYPLMRYYYHTKDKEILDYLELSLEKMANGGIYDHLGGGFARYSVDAQWHVPHFEKMLYDNAQLISLYANAYKLTNNKIYKDIAQETIEFVERDLKSPEGGFYSSFDADSEGVEGKFYLWDKYEVDILLGDKSDIFCDYFNITQQGNWEERNILHITNTSTDIANKYNITETELNTIITESKAILFEQRERRIKPNLDDKVLTSWNALMIIALVDAYQAFDNEKYLKLAEQTYLFIENNLIQKDSNLLRTYKNGKASINGFLDDYAFVIQALIGLYQASFNSKYLIKSNQIIEYVIDHFFDQESGLFNYKSDLDRELVVQTKELMDNVIPSSNSVMAQNLLKLSHYFMNNNYMDIAEQMLITIKDKLISNPYYMANWFDLCIQQTESYHEVCIIGKNTDKEKQELLKQYIPNILIAGGNNTDVPLLKDKKTDNDVLVYVCSNNTCSAPVNSINNALKSIIA